MVKRPKYRPYPLDEPCPCESGLPYRDCCQSKAFKYELDSRNNVLRSVKIPDELIAQLRKQESDFKEKFGRRPGRHDRVFLETYKRSPAQFDEDFKTAALASGVDRAKVYASWKTGLLPTTEHLDVFTELELEEWSESVDEYYELERDGVDPFDTGPQLSKRESAALAKLMGLVNRAPLILASILDRGVAAPLELPDFFQMLFASQALFFLKKFCAAMPSDDFDGGIELCRSIYEAYLRIFYLRHAPDRADIFAALASVQGGEGYEFKKRGDRTNFNVVIERNTGKAISVDISNFKMASVSGRQIDVDVYTVLFRYMSRFVHPNVDMIERNFSQEQGFSIHFDLNPFEGLMISAFVTLLLFFEVAKLNCLRKVQRRDARFLAQKIARAIGGVDSRSINVFSGPFTCLKAKVDDTIIQLK